MRVNSTRGLSNFFTEALKVLRKFHHLIREKIFFGILWNCLRQFFMMFRSGNGGDSMPSDTTRITPNDDPIDEAPVAMA
jgi:hypothetical protein